jgi:glycosyltransferase involved in cell wall biosynthesis
MPKAKVLHIAPTPFFADRGCHIRIEGIVNSLGALGLDNIVCTYHHGRDIEGITTSRISPIKNYTQTAAGPSKYKLLADCKLLWTSFNEYRQQQPVAIHAHLHEGLMIGFCLKLMFFWKRPPLIADIQGSLSGELESHGSFKKLPFLKWPTLQLEKLLLLCANHVVCSSTHSLTQITDDFGMSKNRISLAQDGAKPTLKPSEKEIIQTKSLLNIPNDRCLVVYSGALLDSKGLEELKQIILAHKEQSKRHFLIIGYPTEDLSAFLEEQQLKELCTLTGQLDFSELHKYLYLADIAIDPKHSSAGEGSGKMLNYLACGLPVVAFDSQNNRDFLPEGSVLSSSIEQMLEQLELLTRDKGQRALAASNNLKQFNEHYSWDVTRVQLQPVYSKFVAEHLD